MDKDKIKKIKSIIACIETNNPDNGYELITLLYDGPNNIRQVTLGNGLTEYGGNLKKCIELYIAKKGKFADDFKKYVDKIGKFPSLSSDSEFLDLLKKASKEDQIMRDAQDEIFDTEYWNPSLKWAKDNGFKPTPLSQLIIYDSFVQSGQFKFLRNQFEEAVPVNGGNEKEWIKAYSKARLFWLSNHTNKAVRNSAYRMRTYEKLIKADNWDLNGSITTENGCTIKDVTHIEWGKDGTEFAGLVRNISAWRQPTENEKLSKPH